MSEPRESEDRVTALEQQVDQLKKQVRRGVEDAAAARVLAGGADRDVEEVRAEMREFRAEARGFQAEVRAEFQDVRAEMRTFRDQNNRVLNAMREDIVELANRVGAITNRVDVLTNHVDNGFIAIRGRFDATAAGMDHIVRLLNQLIADGSVT